METDAFVAIVGAARNNGVVYLDGGTSDAMAFLQWALNEGHNVTVMADTGDLRRVPHRWTVVLGNTDGTPRRREPAWPRP